MRLQFPFFSRSFFPRSFFLRRFVSQLSTVAAQEVSVFILISAIALGTADAGRLTMVGTSNVELRLSGSKVVLSGSYNIENRGDETAKDVFPSFELGEWRWAGESRNIEQGKSSEWSLKDVEFDSASIGCAGGCAGLTLPVRGVFPILVRRNYSDLNGYNFSAAEVLRAQLGEFSESELAALRLPEISLRAQSEGNGEEFTLEAEVSNTSSNSITVALAPFSSRELLAISKPLALVVPGGGTASGALKFRNFSGLPGSSYAAYVVAQWGGGELRNTTVASAILSITTPDRSQWFIALAVCAALLMLGTLYYFVLAPLNRTKSK